MEARNGRDCLVDQVGAVRGIDHSKVEGQRLGDQVVEAGSNVLAEDEHQTHRENSDEECDQCGRRSS